MIAVIIVHVIVPDLQHYWTQMFASYYKEMEKELALRLGVKDLSPVFSNMVYNFATGLQAAVMLSFTLANLLLARWLQSLLFNPGGLFRNVLKIRLDYTSLIVFVVFTGLGFSGLKICFDFLPIILLIFSLLDSVYFIQ